MPTYSGTFQWHQQRHPGIGPETATGSSTWNRSVTCWPRTGVGRDYWSRTPNYVGREAKLPIWARGCSPLQSPGRARSTTHSSKRCCLIEDDTITTTAVEATRVSSAAAPMSLVQGHGAQAVGVANGSIRRCAISRSPGPLPWETCIPWRSPW